MKLLVFHNPNAGHDEVPKDRLVDELQRAGHEVTWAEKGEAKLSAILARPFDAVIVAGGDGSVATVGRRLAGRGVPIAILPAGTANNIASSVGATADNLMQLLESGSTRPFDVGVIQGLGGPQRFLEGVGLGAFADTAAILAARGDERFVANRADELARDIHALAEHVRRLEPLRCELELDGRRISGDFLLLEVTNAGVIGPNLRLSASAGPSDARLDVTLVDVTERDELLAFLAARQKGQSTPPPFATYQAVDIVLRAPAARRLHVDGDTLDLDRPLDVRIGIEPAALRVYGRPPLRTVNV